MSTRRETLYKRCPRCRIHFSLCYCHFFEKFINQTPVSILMHFKELPLSSNTAHLAQENLDRCRITLRGHPDAERNQELELFPDHENLILFPDEKAVEIKEFKGRKVHLIVPDGSWRQAKKFHRREPKLQNLTTVKVSTQQASQYLLRTQIHSYGLCTLEAIAYALAELEGDAVKEHLLHKLAIMNERVLISRSGGLHKTID